MGYASSGGRLGPFMTGFNVVKCNWGIGMMTMPYMLMKCGVVAGIVLFGFSMVLSQYAVMRLLEVLQEIRGENKQKSSHDSPASIEANNERRPLLAVANSIQERTEEDRPKPMDYSTIMLEVLGPIGEWVGLASIALSQWGSCIAYMEFIHDNMSKFFSIEHGPTGIEWVIIALVPCIVLAWLDDTRSLSPFSLFGLACAVGFAVVLLYNTGDHVSSHDVTEFFKHQPIIHPKNLPLAFSIAAFCNEGIVVLTPTIYDGMKKPSQFITVTFWSTVYFTLWYLAVGISGNLFVASLDNQEVKSEIALNFDTHQIQNKVAVLLYCLQLITTFAVVYFCAYEAVEVKFLRYYGIQDRKEHLATNRKFKLYCYGVRFIFAVLTGVMAVQIPQFGSYVGLLGALSTATAIYVLPHLCWLKVCAPNYHAAPWKVLGAKLFSYFNILFGLVVAVYGTIQSIQGLMHKGN